jgi:hypothetical protein
VGVDRCNGEGLIHRLRDLSGSRYRELRLVEKDKTQWTVSPPMPGLTFRGGGRRNHPRIYPPPGHHRQRSLISRSSAGDHRRWWRDDDVPSPVDCGSPFSRAGVRSDDPLSNHYATILNCAACASQLFNSKKNEALLNSINRAIDYIRTDNAAGGRGEHLFLFSYFVTQP